MARSFGRKIRVGQLSMIAAAILLPSMSESDWVAKTTDAFFFRSVFSHSRSCCAKAGSSRTSQPSSMMSIVGRPSSLRFDAMEQIGQHRRCGACTDQTFGLEGLDGCFAEPLGFGIEQPAERTADAIRLQRLLQRLAPATARRDRSWCVPRLARTPARTAPTRDVPWRRDRRDAFLGQDGRDPFGSPRALGRIIDLRQRLKRDDCPALRRRGRRRGRASRRPSPARQRGYCRRNRRQRPGRPVAPELQRHQRQQHGLAGAGRADDQGVTDVADMETRNETASRPRSCRRTAAAPQNAHPVPARPIPPRVESYARD